MTREFLIYLAGAGWGVFCGLLGCVAGRWDDRSEISELREDNEKLREDNEKLTRHRDMWRKIANDRRPLRKIAAEERAA
jgi:cell division protein FtsB